MAATLTVTLVNCGGDDDDGDAAPTAESVSAVTVNAFFPAPVITTDTCICGGLDNDNNLDNGQAVVICFTEADTELATGATFTFGSDIPSGTYFFFAAVDVDRSSLECTGPSFSLTSGDYFGYYGGSGLLPPASANVTVPNAGETLEFILSTVP